MKYQQMQKAVYASKINWLGVLLLCFLLFGCDPKNSPIIPKHENSTDRAIRLCEEKGGVPIMSIWAYSLKDCKFPNEVMVNEQSLRPSAKSTVQ